MTNTCDHIYKGIRDPVRSPAAKLVRGQLEVESVQTSKLMAGACLLFLSSWMVYRKSAKR